MARRTPGRRSVGEQGQILVLFALSIVLVLAMAGVAIDAGRFMTQQRFLQNAADAAALAAADAVIQQPSATVASVDQAARANLAINLAGSTVGAQVVDVPSLDAAVFDSASSHVGPNLVSGIALTDGAGTPLLPADSADKITDIRVALRGPVAYAFGGVVGLSQSIISVRAHVGFTGNLVPIAVRRYINLNGPFAGGLCPDPPDKNSFADLAATEATSCQGAPDPLPLGYGGRWPASPSQPGPTIALYGPRAKSSNASSFTGFINLDIRNFDDLNSRVYYNGIPDAKSNTFKAFEAAWISQGYPGPDFPPVTAPADPQDQVAVMDGVSAGHVVSNLNARWNVGDRILCALYDGTVMSIPDFAITGPNSITLSPNVGTPNAGSISIKPNKSFGATVVMSSTNAPAWLTTSFSPALEFTPNQPNGTNVTLSALAAAATPQVDMLWVKGHSASPYLTDHYAPIAVSIAGVTNDFSIAVSPNQAPAAWGDAVTFTATVTVRSDSDFPDGVTLSLEPVGSIATNNTISPPVDFPDVAAGSYSFSTSTITSWSGNGNTRSGTATFTINTTQLGPQKTYDFVLTASGKNSDGQTIRRQVAGQVLSQGTADDSSYVDITGFAVYRITAIDSNSMTGQAISPVFATASDSGLRAALTPRLRPW
jgi:Putative Flp pilus-assembly TadE/G-like